MSTTAAEDIAAEYPVPTCYVFGGIKECCWPAAQKLGSSLTRKV
ncbi:hypothetical protein Sps_01484 [Shewanella psychrophila]|uniref:Uncharacterized protein n=1 Tax=Shewanella psychrophila TaxID=225848 RepID=A0A1S6HMA8_9GAMM|nr:hypothetical protein [Shewanella psychrophila]AQS36650.1 hypothetical protein Sps_01484 [Shewanella psychrophila]